MVAVDGAPGSGAAVSDVGAADHALGTGGSKSERRLWPLVDGSEAVEELVEGCDELGGRFQVDEIDVQLAKLTREGVWGSSWWRGAYAHWPRREARPGASARAIGSPGSRSECVECHCEWQP